MSTPTHNFTVNRGTTRRFDITLQGEDLTGRTYSMVIAEPGGVTTLIEGAGLTIDAVAGKITVELSKELTWSLPVGRTTRYELYEIVGTSKTLLLYGALIGANGLVNG